MRLLVEVYTNDFPAGTKRDCSEPAFSQLCEGIRNAFPNGDGMGANVMLSQSDFVWKRLDDPSRKEIISKLNIHRDPTVIFYLEQGTDQWIVAGSLQGAEINNVDKVQSLVQKIDGKSWSDGLHSGYSAASGLMDGSGAAASLTTGTKGKNGIGGEGGFGLGLFKLKIGDLFSCPTWIPSQIRPFVCGFPIWALMLIIAYVIYRNVRGR